jgi:hypothetical protein
LALGGSAIAVSLRLCYSAAAMAKARGPEEWDADLVGRLQVFVDTWRNFQGTEREGAQDFLRKLLDVYDVDPAPGTIFEQHPIRITYKKPEQRGFFEEEGEVRPTAESMDMYLPRICVWEMKSPSERDLAKHHDQILGYWARVRARYMVLCNFHDFWIYDTAGENGQLEPKLRFPLTELPGRGDALLFLRGEDPDLDQRSEKVTAGAARALGRLVRSLIEASKDSDRDRERIAKFVLECVFAMFAEDTELIPPLLFTKAMKEAVDDGAMDAVWRLFDDFARRNGPEKKNRYAPYVNGPLFDLQHPRLSLTADQMHDIYCAAKDYDWQDVRPEIFGSIFEQALNPVERHELGAYFTREADIARVVVPTVVAPWRQRIDAIRTPKDAARVVEQMRAYHVLDPACGCGNFLYIVYREMKRLESALVARWTTAHRNVAKRRADIPPPPARPYFTLDQIHGIEIDPFAAFLARVVMWIGEHLAKRELGLDEPTLPLKNLDQQIRHGDALKLDWPRPDGELAIASNPPYLGVRKMRQELGDEYVEELFARFPKNRAADYVTYWFTRGLEVLREGERAGYVCTNSVAQNESREASIDLVLAKGGTLTDAWKSYPWPGEAAVHVAIVDWVMGPYDGIKMLDGTEVASISPSLTSAIDVTTAPRLPQNEALCFMGVTPGNKEFVLTREQRDEIVGADPGSASVIKSYLIGRDVNREVDQRPTRWIIDFAVMEKDEAEHLSGAMRHVRRHVYPIRKENRREAYARNWWRFVEPRPGLRASTGKVRRVLVIPCVSPHLVVSRQDAAICFDHQLMVVALGTPFHFGLLQSKIHEVWARTRGSTLKGDLRYTNTTIFETFPFPLQADGRYDPRAVPKTDGAGRAAAAAEEFDRLRAEACKERKLGLTKIHNLLRDGKLPELQRASDAMNDAVNACYGFPEGTWRDEGEVLARLLALNATVAGAGSARG